MSVQIIETEFLPWERLASYEKDNLPSSQYGACAAFTGSMRDFNQGDDVLAMTLEHYPGMTEKQLEQIIANAHSKWPLIDALIIHRVGEIVPGETIVLTATWSAHRSASFEACRYLMEELKTQAPFWKKETLANNTSRWVEKNT